MLAPHIWSLFPRRQHVHSCFLPLPGIDSACPVPLCGLGWLVSIVCSDIPGLSDPSPAAYYSLVPSKGIPCPFPWQGTCWWSRKGHPGGQLVLLLPVPSPWSAFSKGFPEQLVGVLLRNTKSGPLTCKSRLRRQQYCSGLAQLCCGLSPWLPLQLWPTFQGNGLSSYVTLPGSGPAQSVLCQL